MGAHDFFLSRDLFAAAGGSQGGYLVAAIDCDELWGWMLTRNLATLRYPATGGGLTDSSLEVLGWIFCPPTPGGIGLTFNQVAQGVGFEPDSLRERLLIQIAKRYNQSISAACRAAYNQGREV